MGEPVSPPGSPALVDAIERRITTDKRPRYFVYVVLPILITVAGAVAAYAYATSQGALPRGLFTDRAVFDAWRGAEPTTAAIALGIAGISSVGAEVLFYVGAYRLLERRNDHLDRDRDLRQSILDLARADVGPRASADESAHVAAMQKVHADASEREKPRKATLHLFVTVLFNPWVLFVLYCALKDLPRHARRQAHFARHAAAVLATTRGVTLPEMKPMPERSFLLFAGLPALLLVALVAGTWFAAPDFLLPAGAAAGVLLLALHVVWWAWAYDDPVHHFAAQAAFEDALLPVVRGEAASAAAPAVPAAPAARAVSSPLAPTPAALATRPAAAPAPRVASPAATTAAPAAPSEPSTIWACPKCGKKYKVPPKRPVKVTCKACGNAEILR